MAMAEQLAGQRPEWTPGHRARLSRDHVRLAGRRARAPPRRRAGRRLRPRRDRRRPARRACPGRLDSAAGPPITAGRPLRGPRDDAGAARGRSRRLAAADGATRTRRTCAAPATRPRRSTSRCVLTGGLARGRAGLHRPRAGRLLRPAGRRHDPGRRDAARRRARAGARPGPHAGARHRVRARLHAPVGEHVPAAGRRGTRFGHPGASGALGFGDLECGRGVRLRPEPDPARRSATGARTTWSRRCTQAL